MEMKWKRSVALLVVFSMTISALSLLGSVQSVENGDDAKRAAIEASFSSSVTVFGTSGGRYLGGDIYKGANYFYVYANKYSTSGDAYVKRSVDGVNWPSGTGTTIFSGLDRQQGGFCVYTVGGTDHILASTMGYIKRSTDNGLTFSSLASLGEGATFGYNNPATNASMDPSRPYDNNIYVAANRATSGIYLKRSTDDGASWSTYTITSSPASYTALIRDNTRLYCFYTLYSNQIYVASSSDWGKTWGSATKIFTASGSYASSSHVQYIDEQRCLITIQDTSTTPSNSRGIYGYFWYGNKTFQQIGYETGSTYNSPDAHKYAGIAFNDASGINYTSVWCYKIDSTNNLIKTHYSHDSGLNIPSVEYVPTPSIFNYPAVSAFPYVEYSYNASATHPDNGPSTWDLETNATWLSVEWSNDTRCLVKGTPSVPASYWANLTVSDSNSSDYVNWTCRVEKFSPGVEVFSTSGVRYTSGDIFKGANYFYAYADKYSTSGDAYVKRSVDGVNWPSGTGTTIFSGLDRQQGGFCVYTVGGTDHIIASTMGYVKKSTDNGETFSSLASLGEEVTFGYNTAATNASMNPSRPYDHDVYVAASRDISGVYLKRSTDDGSSWSTHTVTSSTASLPALTRNSSRLFCFYSLCTDVPTYTKYKEIYVKNSTDWGKTWGSATKVFNTSENTASVGHAQYIDGQKCLITIQVLSSPISNGKGIYGYFWYGNNTFQQIGCEAGPIYHNPDGATYAGIAFNDAYGINYTSLWCYYVDAANYMMKTHYSHDSGLNVTPIQKEYEPAPSIINVPDINTYLNEEYSFNASATVPDSGTSTWDLVTDATWLSVAWSNDTRCLVKGTPSALGSYWANLEVSDSNSSGYLNWNIHVNKRYTPRSSITIIGDSGFLADNASTGISWGSGTADDPYLIQGWTINGGWTIEHDNGAGIYISCTDAYFKIIDCDIYWADYYSIALYGASNGTISNNTFRDGNNVAHVYLHATGNFHSNNNVISFNNCSGYDCGVYLNDASNNYILNNTFGCQGMGVDVWANSNCNIVSGNIFSENDPWGVRIAGSSWNRIWNNTFLGCSWYLGEGHSQASDSGPNNWWNSTDGYGNWWSEWRSPDDVPPFGIVDLPYNVSGSTGSKDYYPRTAIITNYPNEAAIINSEYSFNASAKLPQKGSSKWSFITNATWLSENWSNDTACLIKGTPNMRGFYWAKLIISVNDRADGIDGIYWNISTQPVYEPHSPVYICGNADFASKAAFEGWPGDGSEGNPYIISRYEINSTSNNGILIKNTDYHFIIRDFNVHSSNHAYKGIYLNNVANARIENCSATDNLYGIYAAMCGNLEISSCNVSSSSGNGLYILSCDNVTISGCNSSSNGDNGVHLHGCTDVTVTDTDTTYNGLNGFYSKNCLRMSVTGGSHSNNLWNGMNAVYCNSTIVEGGDYSDNEGKNGLYMYACNDLSIANLTASQNTNGWNGIFITGCGRVNCTSITASSNAGSGIYAYQSGNVSVIGGSFLSNAMNGVFIYRCFASAVSGATCSDNLQRGVYVLYSSLTTLSSCDLSSNPLGVYALYSNGLHIVDCDVSSNGIYGGISMWTCSDTSIQGGTVSLNGWCGIYIYDCTGTATISSVNATSNLRSGIFTQLTSNVSISGSFVSSNGQYGIRMETGTTMAISGCTVSSNVLTGIYAVGCTYTTMSGNAVKSNHAYGIALTSCKGTNITGSNVSSNTNDGIYAYSSTNGNITWNDLHKNVRGVYLAASASGFNVHHNNFMSNTYSYQAYDPGTGNVWDDGANGNHWSNWPSSSPYGIPPDKVDMHPSVAEW